MLTNREMDNIKKGTFCDFSFYFYYIVSLQKQEICLFSKHFASFAANNVKITFRSTKKNVGLFSSVFRKIFLMPLLY